MNDIPLAEPVGTAAKAVPRHHVWDDSWIGVFILMLIAAVLGGLLSRVWPGGDGLFSTPAGELSEKVEALEARVMQLTNANTGDVTQDVTALRARLTQLEDRVKAAETALATNPQNLATAGVPQAPGAAATVDGLAKQVQELQGRFAVLELGAAATAAAQPGVATGVGAGAGVSLAQTEVQAVKDGLTKIGETVAALTTRVDDMKTILDAAADPLGQIVGVRGDLDGVKARIDKIEKSDPAGAARRAALGAAVASLSRAAHSGQPFQAELAVIRGLQPADASLAALAPIAAKGAPVVATLQSAFPALADAAMKAEQDAKAGEGLDRLWSGVTAMVSVRSTGTPGGADTASVLARAESKLKTGDVRGAYDESGKLQGPARTALDGWRRDAEARIKLDAAIGTLSRAVADSLSRSAVAAP